MLQQGQRRPSSTRGGADPRHHARLGSQDHRVPAPRGLPTAGLVLSGASSIFPLMYVLSCFSHVQLFVDRSPPGSSVHGILQAGILKWGAMPSPRGSSWRRNWTRVSCLLALAGRFFTTSSTWEALSIDSSIYLRQWYFVLFTNRLNICQECYLVITLCQSSCLFCLQIISQISIMVIKQVLFPYIVSSPISWHIFHFT